MWLNLIRTCLMISIAYTAVDGSKPTGAISCFARRGITLLLGKIKSTFEENKRQLAEKETCKEETSSTGVYLRKSKRSGNRYLYF